MSIGSQREWARETSEKLNVRIRKVFHEDKSAETPYKRQQFDEMIAGIRKGLYNVIICWKLDRLARNPEEAGIILGMLKRREIKKLLRVIVSIFQKITHCYHTLTSALPISSRVI